MDNQAAQNRAMAVVMIGDDVGATLAQALPKPEAFEEMLEDHQAAEGSHLLVIEF